LLSINSSSYLFEELIAFIFFNSLDWRFKSYFRRELGVIELLFIFFLLLISLFVEFLLLLVCVHKLILFNP